MSGSPPCTPHSRQTHCPITPSNHSPHQNVPHSYYSFVPRGVDQSWSHTSPPNTPGAPSSATAGQTQPSPQTLLSPGITTAQRWHTPSTTETQQGPSAALPLAHPGSCSWFLLADEALGVDLAEDAVMLPPSPITRPPNKLPAPSPALKVTTTPQNCSLSSRDRAPSVQELGAYYF